MRYKLTSNQLVHLEALIALIIGISLRFIYLDADPHYYSWAGYIADEGRWNESVRNLFHYGSMFIYRSSGDLHLMAAPLFQFTNYLFYLLFDLNHLTSRLFPAICGSSILILFYLHLRFKVTPQAILLGITLLASQADLVMMSRVSIPEIVIMLFQLLVFFTIITTKYSPYNMIAAGFLVLIGVGMKLTMLPFVAIFSAIILTMQPASLNTKGITRKLKELGLFWSGFLLPGFVLATVLYLRFQSFMPSPNEFNHFAMTVLSKLEFGSAYELVAFPFENAVSTTFNIWSLGLWITILTWTSMKTNEINNQCKRLLLSSTIWFVLFFILMQVSKDYPTRYKIHILVPMAIIITIGISLLQQEGIIKIIDSFTKGRPLHQICRTYILTFPTSVFISPLLIFIFGQFSTDSDRVRYKISCIIFSSFVIFTLVYILRFSKKVICFFLVFPIMAGVGWQLLWAFSAGRYHFWIDSESLFHPAVWTFTLLITLITSAVLVCVIYKLSHVFLRRVITIASIYCLTISFVRISPCYLNPQYTIKNTSEKIGTLLSGSTSVASANASSLFIGNNISYRWLGLDLKHSDFPEYIVEAINFAIPLNLIKEKYRPIKRYKLHISPELLRNINIREGSFLYNPDKKVDEVIVYKRIKID